MRLGTSTRSARNDSDGGLSSHRRGAGRCLQAIRPVMPILVLQNKEHMADDRVSRKAVEETHGTTNASTRPAAIRGTPEEEGRAQLPPGLASRRHRWCGNSGSPWSPASPVQVSRPASFSSSRCPISLPTALPRQRAATAAPRPRSTRCAIWWRSRRSRLSRTRR